MNFSRFYKKNSFGFYRFSPNILYKFAFSFWIFFFLLLVCTIICLFGNLYNVHYFFSHDNDNDDKEKSCRYYFFPISQNRKCIKYKTSATHSNRKKINTVRNYFRNCVFGISSSRRMIYSIIFVEHTEQQEGEWVKIYRQHLRQ